ncbi:4-hydroxythreonine-4-phosphate dehydrogenase PdxA [Novosphingobium sp. JCM 18896]|uniref:4-hydroxythreonine-4-phosphate dehydrogenase PdxA n=1 Tax=Novosphingobium sp. JCM 18896 TaxID=2989731 RepID=UPI0022218B2E|nr:4-hydroxythreonine-4-phosphate dehydrogenase PdxA [Novosphingobium sp. JCM 18896]MCW1430999.1 4-hydroxythreonine-4-phosphate dehydrogenase PdxA [Novosphingobium sp. JCM 18896]
MTAPALLPLAASLGDPAGVGPELFVEAWTRRAEEGLVPFFAVGGAMVLAEAAAIRGIEAPVERITDPAQAAEVFARALPVLDLPGTKGADGSYKPGQPDRAGAELALASLTEAARLAVSGQAGAVVTGPIAKSRLAEVGFDHPGQTEFVAAASGVAPQDAVMMLAGPNLRAVPLTVHIALAEVPAALSAALIQRRCTIVAAAMRRDFGLSNPRLALAALNPHAGEDGRFGDEEARIIAPAVAALQAAGLAVTGPHPADAMFAPHARGDYDVALCMYHDQALIPLKALDFDNGVNVTLGLPIIRTSPDHGTAFGIAGKRLAHPGATIAALRMAGECAARRTMTA